MGACTTKLHRTSHAICPDYCSYYTNSPSPLLLFTTSSQWTLQAWDPTPLVSLYGSHYNHPSIYVLTPFRILNSSSTFLVKHHILTPVTISPPPSNSLVAFRHYCQWTKVLQREVGYCRSTCVGVIMYSHHSGSLTQVPHFLSSTIYWRLLLCPPLRQTPL